MRRAKYLGLEIDVDERRTSELYDRMLDWCQCEFCTNAHIARRRHTPIKQVEALRAFGVDPWRPCLSEFPGRRPDDPIRHTRRLSCWFLYGEIVGGAPTPKTRFDHWNWIWADTSREAVQAWDGGLDDLKDDPGLIYVFASNPVPWLSGEVCEFRTEYGDPCKACGAVIWETGYLKRRSMIPVWEGTPHLRDVLLARKDRVFVSFCLSCGRMEHRIVPSRPPFRRKQQRRKGWCTLEIDSTPLTP